MGKGDKKTKKGKIIQGSYGIKRPRKPVKAYVPGSVAPRSAAKAEGGEVSAEALEAKAKKKAAAKTVKIDHPAELEEVLSIETPGEADVVVEPVATEETPEVSPEA